MADPFRLSKDVINEISATGNKLKNKLKPKSKRKPKQKEDVQEDPYTKEIVEDLFIGNLHHMSTGGPHARNVHVWTMFVSTSPFEIIPPKSVAKVTYHLHETFSPRKIPVTEPPFYLQRRGWGYFDVRADIELKVVQDGTNNNNNNGKAKKGKVLKTRHGIHFGLPMVCHSVTKNQMPYLSYSIILQKLVIQQSKSYFLTPQMRKRLNANKRKLFVMQDQIDASNNNNSNKNKNSNSNDSNDNDEKKSEAIIDKPDDPDSDYSDDDTAVTTTDTKNDNNDNTKEAPKQLKRYLTRMLKRGIVSKRWDDIPRQTIESQIVPQALIVQILSNLKYATIPIDICRVIAYYATTQCIEFSNDEIFSQIPQLTHVRVVDCHFQTIVISEPISTLSIERSTNCEIYFNSVERCVCINKTNNILFMFDKYFGLISDCI